MDDRQSPRGLPVAEEGRCGVGARRVLRTTADHNILIPLSAGCHPRTVCAPRDHQNSGQYVSAV